MKKIFLAAAAVAAFMQVPAAQAATIVNVDGLTNASLDGSNQVNLDLAAGTYSISFVTDLFTAFSRFSASSGCNGAGASCVQGWENSVRYVVNGVTNRLGDGWANGGLGPVAGGGYFADEATSFAHSAAYTAQFTLATPGTVSFYLYDDNLSDNRGGVSLAVSAVPEPATWAMMIAGFGLAGASLRRRKTAVSFA